MTTVFGYTCVSYLSARAYLISEKDFARWTRAKGFDDFEMVFDFR